MSMMPFDTTPTPPQGATASSREDRDWWRGAVIYQIYPRSYFDTNGDGIGDLDGIAEKLDYVAGLGVDAIWLSPFFPSPMKDFGYDVSDHCDVDAMFGTMESFDRLLAGAHARGVRVLIDLVLSHTSNRHPWFAESRRDRSNPKADWYVWADPKPDGTPPNNWLSIFGGPAWAWDSARRQYYLHNFLDSQPDLNFHCEAVQDAVLDIARFWLDRGVDGFRLDTVNMYTHDRALRDNPPMPPGKQVNGVPASNPYAFQDPIHNINRPENLGFIARLRALTDSYGATTTVGELGAVTDMYSAIAEYTAPGYLHMAYSFDLMTTEISAARVRRIAEQMRAEGPQAWPNWALSNHDVERVMTRWGLHDAHEAAPVLVAMVTSLRGSACLYQGEELGLPEAEVAYEDLQDPYGIRFWPDFKGRDGARTPMPWCDAPDLGFSTARPWLPAPPAHRDLAVSRQSQDPQSPLNRVRRYLAWRKTLPVLRNGDIRFFDAPEPVLVFRRERAGEALLCAFNLGAAAVALDLGAALDGATATPLAPGGFEQGARLDGVTLRLDGWAAAYVHCA